MEYARRSLKVPTYLLALSVLLATSLQALEADDLADLVGYTIVVASTVSGEFEGADHDKLVKLDNGMIFQFTEYRYTYSYRPSAVVLARTVTTEELRKLIPSRIHTKPLILYKLIVEDEIYDVIRVR
jgi:hypothetical protein